MATHKLDRYTANIALFALLVTIVLPSAVTFSRLFNAGVYSFAALLFALAASIALFFAIALPRESVSILLLALPLAARLTDSVVLNLQLMIMPVEVLVILIVGVLVLLKRPLQRDILSPVFWLFFLIMALSCFADPSDSSLTILISGILTQYMMFRVVEATFKSRSELRFLMTVLSIILFYSCIFAFIQPIINHKMSDYIFLRLTSFFYNPIIFAGTIVLLWPYFLILNFSFLKSKRAAFWIKVILCIVGFVALLLTGSRGALMVYLLQVGLLIFDIKRMERVNKIKYSKIVSIFIIIVTIATISNYGILDKTVFRRFNEIDFNAAGNSADERVLGAKGGIELGLAHPMLGVGLGNFRFAYPHTIAANGGKMSLESAHNFIINLFAEGGAPAALLWMLMVAIVFSRIRRISKGLMKLDPFMFVALKLSFFGFVIYSFAFYGEFLHKNVGLPMILYWTVVAMISAEFHRQKA